MYAQRFQVVTIFIKKSLTCTQVVKYVCMFVSSDSSQFYSLLFPVTLSTCFRLPSMQQLDLFLALSFLHMFVFVWVYNLCASLLVFITIENSLLWQILIELRYSQWTAGWLIFAKPVSLVQPMSQYRFFQSKIFYCIDNGPDFFLHNFNWAWRVWFGLFIFLLLIIKK